VAFLKSETDAIERWEPERIGVWGGLLARDRRGKTVHDLDQLLQMSEGRAKLEGLIPKGTDGGDSGVRAASEIHPIVATDAAA
jgi:hypothetical protein